MSDEMTLLPCPFCGSEAHVLKDGLPYVIIECEHCFCRTNCNVTEAEAIAAWNNRAELTCHDANIGGSFVCSECGANVKNTDVGRSYTDDWGKRWYSTSNDHAFNYCPNCGAKVVGK